MLLKSLKFQERIRNLVFRMIEKQFKTLKGPFHFYPERIFVQYLLPCFATSFFELKNDRNMSRQTRREDYMLFVHELIKSYEESEYCQELSSEKLKIPSMCVLRRNLKKANIIGLVNGLEESLKDAFTGSRSIDLLFTKGLKYLADYKSQLWPKTLQIDTDQQCPWLVQLYMFFSRIRTCAQILEWFKRSPEETYAHMNCILSDELVFKIVCDIELLPIWAVWLRKVVRKTQENNQPPSKKKKINPLLAAMFKDADALRLHQLLGVVIYYKILDLDRGKVERLAGKLQGPGFPGEFADEAFWSLLANDLAKLKQMFSPVKKSGDREDLTLVPLEFAKGSHCYDKLLQNLTSEGKLKMNHPGEITFFPIKHCRWCGLLQVKKFRVCSVCKENPDYPDVNFFCSEFCEKESLAKQHEEEHVRFLMLKLGI